MCIYVLLGICFGLAEQALPFGTFISQEYSATISVLVGLAFWYIAGTAYNDYADYEIDKINLPRDTQRPLIQGAISRNNLLLLAHTASCISLVSIATTRNLPLLVLFTSLVLLNIAYSLRPLQISHRAALAPMLLPLGYVILTVNAGFFLVHTPYTITTYALVAAMYLHFMSRIVLKDYRDVQGDAKAGKRTLVLVRGNQFVAQLAIALLVCSTLLLLYILYSYVRTVVPYILFLGGAAAYTLHQLSLTTVWKYQKPLITIYGRLCSGIITLVIAALLQANAAISTQKSGLLYASITALFFMSIFSIIQLQHPRQKSTH